MVMGGCFSYRAEGTLTGRDIHFLDFMEDTVVTEENAVATAEGTIAELVEKKSVIILMKAKEAMEQGKMLYAW